jgi:phage gpG-like protein
VRSKSFTEANPSETVRDPVKYLPIVTGGRKAITAKVSKILYSAATNRFFGKSVAAAKPNPFFERAFDSSKEEVAGTILQKAPGMIESEAQKLAR